MQHQALQDRDQCWGGVCGMTGWAQDLQGLPCQQLILVGGVRSIVDRYEQNAPPAI